MIGVLLGLAWGAVVALPVARRARAASVRVRVGPLRPSHDRHGRWRNATAPRGRGHGIVARVVAVARSPHRRAQRRARSIAIERALPLALDVMTMAARAGATPRLALGTAARWSPPEIGAALATVEARCRLGRSFGDALDDLGDVEPALRTVADALLVVERSGAPVAALLGRLSDEARASLRRRSEAHARRVPVRLLFPLVFLVLPAFGLLTVVPALAAGLRSS